MKKYFSLIALIALPLNFALAQTTTTGQAAAADAAVAPNSQAVPAGLAATEPNSQTVSTGQAPSSAAFLPIPTDIQVPATTAPAPATANGKVKLIVSAKKSGTNRLLGLVKVTMSDGTNTQDATLLDPPTIGGQPIFEATPGAYTLNISRSGYKSVTNKQIQITAGQDLKLSIDLEPEVGTASPENEYQARIMAQLFANMTSQNTSGYPSSYNNSYNTTGQYYGTNGQYIPGTTGTYNTQTGQYISNTATQYNPNFSQNGYLLTANQSSIIPFVANIQMNGLINANQSSNVALIDSSTGNSMTLSSSNPSTTYAFNASTTPIYRSGCVKPNNQYILRVSSNQQLVTGQQPYQDFQFVSPGVGSYVNVNIQPPMSLSYGGSNIANVSIQNLMQNNTQLGINCPSTYNNATQTSAWPVPGVYTPNTGSYTGQPPYGTTTWSDPTVNPINFGNYHVDQNQQQTAYFLVSNINMYEQRQIKFVENSSGSGGLAFVPADSSVGTAGYSAQWYVTTYTRDINSQISKCTAYIGKLQALSQYQTLTTTIKNDITQNLSVINAGNQDTAKTRLNTCNALQQSLVNNLRTANPNITIPPMDSAPSIAPTINLSQLARVNFTPDQYSQAVSGQVLNSF